MKKNLQTFIMGSLTLFAIYLYSLSDISVPPNIKRKEAPPINTTSEEDFALNYLNRLRIGSGLIPFSSQTQLKQAAQAHAEYLIKHHIYGHKEDENLSGYTGTYASKRIEHAGYPSHLVIENVSNYNRNAKESIDGLMSAIYHRFAFLSFKADEIGIGIKQNSLQKEETSFVYNLSAKAIRTLCRENNETKIYKSYSKVCNNRKIKVSTLKLNEAFNTNNTKNRSFIVYPFDKQYDVPPAFFNELPDPLPDYNVSGFPISINFNPTLYKNIKILTFDLFDNTGKQIVNVRKHDYKSDPNKRLKETEFVLFPLQRLKWDSSYSVKITAIIQEKIFTKEWTFHTRSFKEKIHQVSNTNKLYHLKKDEAIVFYFPPTSPSDVLHNLSYTGDYDIKFIDQNTIRLTAFKAKGCCSLRLGKHTLNLEIHN